ncbi:unnamed protein product [Zymoseptoria tritici ST99CH_3D1]|nr:unnamed protein product [Zymoseptoria tritici ST99CH_3D1]
MFDGKPVPGIPQSDKHVLDDELILKHKPILGVPHPDKHVLDDELILKHKTTILEASDDVFLDMLGITRCIAAVQRGLIKI